MRMMNTIKSLVNKADNLCDAHALRVARVLLGGLFVIAGVMKIFSFGANVELVASKGLPLPGVVLVIVILIEIGAGLAVILNKWVRIAVRVLVLFTILTILLFHLNWSDPIQFITALKNLAIIGGLLALGAVAPHVFESDGDLDTEDNSTDQM